MKKDLREIADSAVRQGVTPGLAAAVAVIGPVNKSWSCCSGWLASDHQARVSPTTFYDLSSLSKVLNTTILAAIAVSRGVVSLRTEPWPHWPGVTIAHILSHTSGLVAHHEFFRQINRQELDSSAAKRKLIQAVLNCTPQYRAGQRHIYSDLGFIALGDLLEKSFGAPLDQLFTMVVGKHIPIGSMHYRRTVARQPDGSYAPTAAGFFSNTIKSGVVDDDNCYAMGGVAGHAGLFGSLNDLLGAAVFFAEKMLHSEEKLFSVLRRFAAHRPWPLGFDRVSRGGSTGGALPADAFGHLGFTGTSLWFDLDYEKQQAAVYALLTNRVHYKTAANKILSLRQNFHRAAARWTSDATANVADKTAKSAGFASR